MENNEGRDILVKSVFGISDDEYSLVCAYREANNFRLLKIYVAAKNWQNSGFPKPDLKETILGGKSLFDFLTAEKIDQDAIQFIGGRFALHKDYCKLNYPF